MGYTHFSPALYKIEHVFTGTGDGENLSTGNNPVRNFAIQVEPTGAVLLWTVVLQVSFDGINYTDLITHTQLLGANVILYSAATAPAQHFRAKCTVLSLGLGTNIKTTITGSN